MNTLSVVSRAVLSVQFLMRTARGLRDRLPDIPHRDDLLQPRDVRGNEPIIVLAQEDDKAYKAALWMAKSLLSHKKHVFFLMPEGVERQHQARKHLRFYSSTREGYSAGDVITIGTGQRSMSPEKALQFVDELDLSAQWSDALIDFFGLNALVEAESVVSFLRADSHAATTEMNSHVLGPSLLTQAKAMITHYTTPKSGVFLGQERNIMFMGDCLLPRKGNKILIGRRVPNIINAKRLYLVNVPKV